LQDYLVNHENPVNPVIHIYQASGDDDIQRARTLFEEYQSGLGISLCFQNFDLELKNLPGDYAPPDGRLLLATEDDQLAGCIALRKLAPSVCEMKRLFVRPTFRGKRLGKVLVESIIDEARKLGYTHMRLDTLPGRMDKAIALYQSMGFVDIGPYCENPVEGAKFMELDLHTREHTQEH
jgi:GNAT superfamily N-acetyltransferase